MPDRVVRRILVPIELADPDATDLDYAFRLARQLQAEVVLLTVIDTPAIVALIGHHRARLMQTESFRLGLVDDAKAILQRLVDEAARRGVQALGHATVSEEVEAQILKEALVQKVDLILVRSAGHHGLMKALLGTTAGDILKAAPCPVLIARRGA
jgi:nucleotide-binding universal stress UspA family protein